MKKYHYVYLLENKEPKDNRKYYFGVRSCDCLPENDKYFSSSKTIKNLIKINNTFNKKIIKRFSSRVEAVDYEIFLHNQHDVAHNKYFYNLAKQTSTKFDSSGFIYINGVRIPTQDYYLSSEKYHSYGKITLCDKYGKKYYVNIDDERRLTGELSPITKGMTPIRLEDGTYVNIPTSEYNKDSHKTSNSGKIPVIDKNGNTSLVNSTNKQYLSGELVSVHKGKILCKDNKGNVFLLTKNQFEGSDYVGVNKGNVSNSNNPNAKEILIYNKDGKIMFTCLGNFKTICKSNNLPFASLSNSYRNNGLKIYNSKIGIINAKKLNNEEFIGWYAMCV
jgi:hypothetical protein